MDHVNKISSYLEILIASNHFNLLTVIGPAGWAKTETTRTALTEKKVKYGLLGSYSTPLGLYNRLAKDADQLLVIDDSAGLFSDPKALAILNAATWPGADGRRVLTWESTSDRVGVPKVDFTGKIAILANHMPSSPAARALVSRGMRYDIDFDWDSIRQMLEEAASCRSRFQDHALAAQVLAFLLRSATLCDPKQLNLRTLRNAYEVAAHVPNGWEDLVRGLLPKAADDEIVRTLHESGRKIKDQLVDFVGLTGKSERTFYVLRAKLGLARPQVNRKGNLISMAKL